MRTLRMLLWILLALIALPTIALVFYFMLSPRIGSDPTGARQTRIDASPNFRDGKFQNVVPTNMEMPVSTMGKVMWEMLKGGDGREPDDTIPNVPFDRMAWEQLPDTGFAIAWFGHSSLLIKMDAITFLVDPVFGERASSFSFAGPKRFAYREHMRVDLLPKVDAVLISHDHYDHLDHETVLQLKDERFIVPLGVGAHLESWGVPSSAITEHDWWQTTHVAAVKLTLAPARHFSGRALTNRFSTLWGSWVIEGKERRVLFGADSGYAPTFKELGTRFGHFDLALLECGAYNVQWSEIHMMPEETAQAAVDLNAAVLMPIHWAKFNLALHPWKEPIERLSIKAAELNVPLLTPALGRTVVGADLTASVRWWEAAR
ncbi:MAG: MBL fold metallo-hydrolase [Flavobacteriales bacterium]|nr:MBL fold metallo-hydrolase [Flavobacteriales bacterium]